MILYGTSRRDDFAGTDLDDFLYGYTSIGGPEFGRGCRHALGV